MNISTLIFLIPDSEEIMVPELYTKIMEIDSEAVNILNLPKTKDTLYASLTKLEQNDYIQSRTEKRMKMVKLTDKGRALVVNLRALIFAGNVEDIIDGFTGEMSEAIKKIIVAYSRRLFK